MNNFHRLKNQLTELYSLTRLQRGLRLLLRAFWLGIAGLLVGWGLNALFGWLPNPASWILVGLAFALVPVMIILISLYPVLFSLPPHPGWVRKIDQQYNMREQFSTAWELAEKESAAKPAEAKPGAKEQTGLVSDLLVQEMLVEVPRLRTEMMKDGWYRKTDLASSVIAMMLACMMLGALLYQRNPDNQTQNPPEAVPQSILPQPQEEQPQPGQEPAPGEGTGGESQEGAGEQPGEGTAGEDGSAEGSTEGSPTGDQPGEGGAGEPSDSASAEMDAEALAEALQNMGSELSQQAGTYEFGQALENLDMEGSAQALEDLNEALNELSPETRENMAQAMQDAANAIEEAGQSEMSQNMEEAAEALPEGEESANQALGDVANDLRQMGSAMQPSSGANSGAGQGQSAETGSPEPLERLTDEGGNLDLPLENGEQSELLSPAPPDAAGEGTASGTLDSTGRQGENAGQNPILPNSLLWRWRNVVSEYFQR